MYRRKFKYLLVTPFFEFRCNNFEACINFPALRFLPYLVFRYDFLHTGSKLVARSAFDSSEVFRL